MEIDRDSNVRVYNQLREIFRRADMADLPAMSGNVQELLLLTGSSRSAAQDLAEVILRDYSLTNKVLRVVNSAYYGLPQPINNVTRAVTIVGFDVIREMAGAIVLFEDFVITCVDKNGVVKMLTRSLLSGLQAKMLVVNKKILADPEEAFICGMLHNLGKIVVQVYFPDLYQEIELRMLASLSVEAAAREKLNGLSFQDIGQEMARFWHLSPKLVEAMTPYPPQPAGPDDSEAYLQNMAAFTNVLTDRICSGEGIVKVLKDYKDVLDVSRDEALLLVRRSVELAEEFSDTVRSGLYKLRIHHRLSKLG